MEVYKRMKEESILLLTSIVTGQDALAKVKSRKQELRKLEEYLNFEYKTDETRSNDANRCACWYENEYFEYVHCNEPVFIHNRLFNKIIDRIRNGKCEHVKDETLGEHSDGAQVTDDKTIDLTDVYASRNRHRPTTFVSYLHAAAAVGNTKLVVYLCRKYPDYSSVRTASGLVAFHLAVLKQHVHTVKSLHKENVPVVKGIFRFSFRKIKQQPLSYNCNWNEYQSHFNMGQLLSVNIYSRSNESDKVTKVELGLYDIKSPMVSLLKSIEHPKLELLLQCTDYLEDKQKTDIMIDLLIKGQQDCATEILKTTPKENIHLALKVACILTDSEVFLDAIIRAGANMFMPGYDYTLQDLADAVASYKCVDMLQKKNSCLRGPKERTDPFSALICYGSLTIQYIGREFVLGFLNKIQGKGYDINKRDRDGFTPLQDVLIKPQKLILQSSVTCDFASRLIELGANIDTLDNSFVSKSILFNYFRHSRYSGVNADTSSIISLLLYYNSDPRCNQDLLYYCHHYERKLYNSLVRLGMPLDGSNLGQLGDEILNITYQKSLFAVLFELGFGVHKASAGEIDRKVKQMWPIFYRRVYTQPRSLQSICRITVRCSHPGIKLFKMLQHDRLPVSIENYLLAKDLLSSKHFRIHPNWARGNTVC